MTLLEKYREEREIGKMLLLIKIVCEISQKDYSVSEIADLIGEDKSLVQKIYDAAAESAPDYDIDSILEKIM